MNIMILGPQGSGKGTQAQLLVDRKGFTHLEMGRILRSISKSDNQYAQVVSNSVNTGELVPDEYVRLIAWDFVNKHNPKTHNLLFEGYPRTIAQYDQVQDIFRRFGKKIDAVINVEISSDESIKRLSSRVTCDKCGEVFNLITNPPQTSGKCDKCLGSLIVRKDDEPQAIARRLEIYRQNTHPIFTKAKNAGIGIEVNGELPIEEVYKEIISQLGV